MEMVGVLVLVLSEAFAMSNDLTLKVQLDLNDIVSTTNIGGSTVLSVTL